MAEPSSAGAVQVNTVLVGAKAAVPLASAAAADLHPSNSGTGHLLGPGHITDMHRAALVCAKAAVPLASAAAAGLHSSLSGSG